MPAPAHYRLTYSGTLGDAAAPQEIWACTLAASRGTSPFLTRADLVSSVGSLVTPFSANILPKCSGAVRLTRLRIAQVGDEGRVAVDSSGAFIQADSTVAIGGTASGLTPPWQISLAIGLRTVAAGSTGRGRFYVPVPTVVLGTDGRMSTTDQTGWATTGKAFINALNSALATAQMGRVVIASGGSALKSIPPALRDVTAVEVGRVYDTQRRRRSALVEARVLTPL